MNEWKQESGLGTEPINEDIVLIFKNQTVILRPRGLLGNLADLTNSDIHPHSGLVSSHWEVGMRSRLDPRVQC